MNEKTKQTSPKVATAGHGGGKAELVRGTTAVLVAMHSGGQSEEKADACSERDAVGGCRGGQRESGAGLAGARTECSNATTHACKREVTDANTRSSVPELPPASSESMRPFRRDSVPNNDGLYDQRIPIPCSPSLTPPIPPAHRLTSLFPSLPLAPFFILMSRRSLTGGRAWQDTITTRITRRCIESGSARSIAPSARGSTPPEHAGRVSTSSARGAG